MNNSISKQFIAEVIGTFALVTAVCGAILTGQTGALPAFAGGLAIMTMIYAVGGISGGHFNPAVTLASTISGRTNTTQMVAYMVAQLVGGLLAVTLLQTITTASLVTAVAAPAAGVSSTSAIVAEAVGTFFLALTVLGVTSNQSISRSFSGLAIGGTIVLAGLTIGNLTGGSVNPARAIAPAVLSGEFANLATYIIGPVIGAAVAGLISNVLFTADASSSSSSSFNNSNNSQQSRRAA